MAAIYDDVVRTVNEVGAKETGVDAAVDMLHRSKVDETGVLSLSCSQNGDEKCGRPTAAVDRPKVIRMRN
jgi:hypothetical protein